VTFRKGTFADFFGLQYTRQKTNGFRTLGFEPLTTVFMKKFCLLRYNAV
jgi:hypothetical protein